MRAGGGKQKGASFERLICVKLSLWVSKGTFEDAFWRSAMSGGRSTVAHARGKRLAAQAGDITCTHPIGQAAADKFLFECKTYKSLDYHGLLTGKGKLLQFWNETKAEAKRYGKWPFMIAKQNQLIPTVCLSLPGVLYLVGDTDIQALIHAKRHGLWIFGADEFFEKVKPPYHRPRLK